MKKYAGSQLAIVALLGMATVPALSTMALAGADDGGTKAFWMNENPGDTAQAPTVSNIPTNARANYQGSEDTALPTRHHVRNIHRYVR